MTRKRILILAGGSSERWDDSVFTPEKTQRHMVPVPHWERHRGHPDFPLIHRTQAQVAGPQRLTGTMHEVYVVTQASNTHFINPEIPYPQMGFTVPDPPTRGWEQEWDGSRSSWAVDMPTVLLLGDTHYTDELLATMLNDKTDHWHFYARFGASPLKPYGEGLGWVIHPSAHDHLDYARAQVKQSVEMGLHNRASGWEVYRQACGLPIWLHSREFVHGIDVGDDASEDFDTLDEYQAWYQAKTGVTA